MVFVLRCIVACLFCFAVQGSGAAVLQLGRAEVALASGPGGAPGPWQSVALPHDWEDSFPGYSGIAWYRLQFEVPADAGAGLLAVYIQRACTNAEIYLNGEQVSGAGPMTGAIRRNCYYPQLATISRATLRPGTNELRIRLAGFAAQAVSARQREAGLSDVRIGPLNELQPLFDRQQFWNITMAQIIAATIGALGLAMLGLAAVRRRDSYLLYFGLFSTGWALISTRLFVQDIPLESVTTEILICSTFPPVLGCAYLFLMRFVERRYHWMSAFLAAQTVLVPFVLWWASPSYLLTAASTVYNLLAIEFLVCATVFFRVAWREFRREFWLMGSVLAVAAVLAAIEIALQNDWLPLPRVHVIHFAMPFLFAVIGVRLIQMFVRALNQAETANQVLEQRVAEKSREIEHKHEQLATLRTAQAEQNERQRIASDLHDDLGAQLLTIAQTSLQTHDRERVATLARQALEEMRLSVRGLTGDAARADNVLADWRAETVTRLDTASFTAHWEADEPPDGLVLPARTHVQLTRVLREAVSNAIRHSGGTCCRVRIGFVEGRIAIEVEDDGRGLAGGPASGRVGHGLPNIERRVRGLQGRHEFARGEMGGTLLRLDVPLEPKLPSANMGRL